MNRETYTPGHTENATRFMANRTLESHGQFFAPYLEDGLDILDIGCGPGTISIGLANTSLKGKVIGVDFGDSQIEKARSNAKETGLTNLEFQVASCYELPFEDETFDRVFCHALMEHLARPVDMLSEAFRVLKPEGTIGICSPDADGWLLSPPSRKLKDAIDAYISLQEANGGNLRVGKHFGDLLEQAGFGEIEISARYECYPSLVFIGEYLALQLADKDMHDHAQILRKWSESQNGMFAQAWVAAVGRKNA